VIGRNLWVNQSHIFGDFFHYRTACNDDCLRSQWISCAVANGLYKESGYTGAPLKFDGCYSLILGWWGLEFAKEKTEGRDKKDGNYNDIFPSSNDAPVVSKIYIIFGHGTISSSIAGKIMK